MSAIPYNGDEPVGPMLQFIRTYESQAEVPVNLSLVTSFACVGCEVGGNHTLITRPNYALARKHYVFVTTTQGGRLEKKIRLLCPTCVQHYKDKLGELFRYPND